jgi:hypothetical protein
LPDISRAISAQERYSTAITTMASNTKKSSKAADHLERIFNELSAQVVAFRR